MSEFFPTGVLQLQYFGEVFDPTLCKKSGTPCDNCENGFTSSVNVTALAKSIVEGVQRLRFDRIGSILCSTQNNR